MQGTASVVRVDRVGDVAVLVLTHPPVNALSASVRAGLAQGLQEAVADPEIVAIVLRGEGRGFSAGADITEFGKVKSTSGLGDLCLRIETCPKPVIAALHGSALGGGLEIALAAHYRIANAKCLLGLPEVNLGLLPGGGGTQRLPRLIGAAEALRMMLTGVPIPAAQGLAMGLIDRVVESDLTEAAVAMANEGLSPRRTSDRRTWVKDMQAWAQAVASAREAQRGNRLPAPERIIDCVEAAALLPLQQGLNAEAAAFGDLVDTPEAAGLRYAFFTERRAALPPQAVAAKGIQPIGVVGVWGVDDMSIDLVFQALTAGMRVVFVAPERAVLVDALERVAARQEQAVVAEVMTEDARDADWARLTTSTTPEVLATAELVLATPEAPVLPDGMAHALIGAAQDGAEVAISVPGALGGLAEVSMTDRAAPDAVARVLALARRLNWRTVFAGPGGSIELALRQALAGAIAHLQAEGVRPELLTAALAAYGIGARATSVLPPMPRGGAEIVACCLAAMAAEGARLLQDGRARRPLDIDAVALMSGVMPRWEGGPMYQADQRGLLVLRQDLLRRAEALPLFRPCQVIDDLIAEGQGFASLNGR